MHNSSPKIFPFELVIFMIPIFIVLPIGIHVGSFYVTLGELLFVIAFYISLLCGCLSSRLGTFVHTLKDVWALLLFVVCVILSCMFNPVGSQGIKFLFRYVEILFFIFLLTGIFDIFRIKILSLIKTIYITSILGCFVPIIIKKIRGGGFGTGEGERLGADYLGGSFGVMPAIGCLISVYLMLTVFQKGKGIKLLLPHLISYLAFISILMINSTRTWAFVTILGSFFIFWYSERKIFLNLAKKILPLIFVLLMIGVVVGGFTKINFIGMDSILDRWITTNSILMGDFQDTSIGSRINKWNSALLIFKNNPLWGVGLENLNLGMPVWIDPLSNKRSDNQYLDVLAMSGIFAFAFLLLFFGILTKRLFSCKEKNILLFALFVAIIMVFCVGGIFWAFLYGYSGLFFAFNISVCFFYVKENNNKSIPQTRPQQPSAPPSHLSQ